VTLRRRSGPKDAVAPPRMRDARWFTALNSFLASPYQNKNHGESRERKKDEHCCLEGRRRVSRKLRRPRVFQMGEAKKIRKNLDRIVQEDIPGHQPLGQTV